MSTSINTKINSATGPGTLLLHAVGSRENQGMETVRVPLHCHASGVVACESPQPVRFGVPLPKGLVRRVSRGRLFIAGGRPLPVQLGVSSRWGDGSIRWLLLDCVVGSVPSGETDASLELLESDPTEEVEENAYDAIRFSETQSTFSIDTGPMQFEIQRARGTPVLRLCANGSPLSDSNDGALVFKDARGRRQMYRARSVEMESAGPVRCTVRIDGDRGRSNGLRCRLRLHFFAGTGLIKLETTLHNPRRAVHKSGQWDLGDPGSILFAGLSLRLSLHESLGGSLTCRLRTDPEATWQEFSNFSLTQESSGGENWRSLAHVNRHGEVHSRFRGFRLESDSRADAAATAGLRAEPTAVARGSGAELVVAVPEFWQQFPKSIVLDEGQLSLGLFPEEFDDLHELQGGERKTHTVWLEFLPDGDAGCSPSENRLDWVFSPMVFRPAPSHAGTLAVAPRMTGLNERALGRFESYLQEALEGDRGLLANRERADEFGWRNFGDIVADHEQLHYAGSEPLVSHYNNQFDMLYGFLLQFLRTGDRRWWELADQLARHAMEIDLYDTEEDRPVYNGGAFWFTDHYRHAHTSTHRTYTRKNKPAGGDDYGGGPGAEHNFTTGLRLYHELTGSPEARAAVIQLAEWVLNMDDGSKTILRLIHDGPTGKATATADSNYHGPGRAAGNSINALLDGFALTGDPEYLQYAEGLIRRCIHPEDEVGARELLNVEKRWSYTVFLSTLARYLADKGDLGEFDAMYGYAQASLLRYARWMLAHERPYFDQVERLEFPTETWAAQEFRKANVMRLAAEHAEEPLRTKLLDRGDALAERAWNDLQEFDTRFSARAVAIVMKEGLLDCVLRDRTVAPARRVQPGDWPPVPFVPQKQAAFARLTSLHGLLDVSLRLLWPPRRRPS